MFLLEVIAITRCFTATKNSSYRFDLSECHRTIGYFLLNCLNRYDFLGSETVDGLCNAYVNWLWHLVPVCWMSQRRFAGCVLIFLVFYFLMLVRTGSKARIRLRSANWSFSIECFHITRNTLCFWTDPVWAPAESWSSGSLILCLQIENELKTICNDILVVLDKHLIPTALMGESRVFYYKM